jgi:Oxidoreductase family, C-terminal alpha/beta domain/Oxidoreductase family, NAD-binding Rossmann fold
MSEHSKPIDDSKVSQGRIQNGSRRRPTRRQFLKSTAAVTGAVIAAPLFVRAEALGLNGGTAASERIVLGGIGIGPRGEFDLRWMLKEKDVQFVAVCDIQKKRREFVKNLADEHHGNKDCAMYRDLREFLAARKDIDALLIATGDRWHAMATILAMESGKDVYSEKPSCMTVTEGKAVVAAAKKHNRIYQTGTQRLSEATFTVANELFRLGRLGEVHTVRAHIAPWDDAYMRHDSLPGEPEPPKEEVDWDIWLGPCPKRPYNHKYVEGGWRGYYDFHTSCIGEWGAHTFAQCQVAIGAGDTSGIAYTFVPNKTGDGMVVKYANGIKMVLQREGWRGPCGVRYEGSEGWVAVADDYKTPEVSSPALLADSDKLVKDYMERTGRPMNHVRDFFDCVKSRKQTVANPTVMHRSMSTVHACNICMWLKRDVKYDPAKEEFVDNAEANKYLARVIRKPWSLEG